MKSPNSDTSCGIQNIYCIKSSLSTSKMLPLFWEVPENSINWLFYLYDSPVCIWPRWLGRGSDQWADGVLCFHWHFDRNTCAHIYSVCRSSHNIPLAVFKSVFILKNLRIWQSDLVNKTDTYFNPCFLIFMSVKEPLWSAGRYVLFSIFLAFQASILW